jgi:mannose-6-phosphate isomerase class I
MKNSDNVVRLGLTPKLKDVETMLKIMKDQVGLDGLEVERTEHGYIWNNLVLNPQELKGEVKEIEIRQ